MKIVNILKLIEENALENEASEMSSILFRGPFHERYFHRTSNLMESSLSVIPL